jgi:hypothetical protein
MTIVGSAIRNPFKTIGTQVVPLEFCKSLKFQLCKAKIMVKVKSLELAVWPTCYEKI